MTSLSLSLLGLLVAVVAGGGQPAFMRPAGGICNLTGSWVDGSGAYSRIQQFVDRTLLATAVTPEPWVTAPGMLSPDSSSLWMNFSSSSPVTLTADVVAACTVLRFSNGATWTRSQPPDAVHTVHVVFMTQ